MSRVITFSRTFPVYHPKAWQPTYFVEKLLKALTPDTTYFMAECEWCGWRGISSLLDGGHSIADTGDYSDPLCPECGSNKIDDSDENQLAITYYNQSEFVWPKHHTIRSGNRWKVGDKFSPRVWSGKPYASKMITIAPDITIEKIWDFEVVDMVYELNGRVINYPEIQKLAENDGLSIQDFHNWFIHYETFKGQIICWNKDIQY